MNTRRKKISATGILVFSFLLNLFISIILSNLSCLLDKLNVNSIVNSAKSLPALKTCHDTYAGYASVYFNIEHGLPKLIIKDIHKFNDDTHAFKKIDASHFCDLRVGDPLINPIAESPGIIEITKSSKPQIVNDVILEDLEVVIMPDTELSDGDISQRNELNIVNNTLLQAPISNPVVDSSDIIGISAISQPTLANCTEIEDQLVKLADEMKLVLDATAENCSNGQLDGEVVDCIFDEAGNFIRNTHVSEEIDFDESDYNLSEYRLETYSGQQYLQICPDMNRTPEEILDDNTITGCNLNKSILQSLYEPHATRRTSEKTRWSKEEQSLVLNAFAKNIKAKKLPTLPDIRIFLQNHSDVMNRKRTASTLKTWISNYMKDHK